MNASDVPRTLQEAIAHYLNRVDLTHSPQVGAAYTQALNLFRQMLHSQLHLDAQREPITNLSIAWGQAYLTYLQSARSVETEHLYSRALVDFFDYAEKKGWAAVNAAEMAAYVAAHRRPKEHNIPHPPLEAIDRLLAYVAAVPVPSGSHTSERERLRVLRDRAFLLTLAETGLKVSEICALRRRHFRAEARAIQLDDEGPTLRLTPITSQAISTYLRERVKLDTSQTLQPSADLPLFARHDKRAGKRVLPFTRWTSANIIESWTRLALPAAERAALEATGRHITAQTFRHYFVINTLAQTRDLTITRTLARHGDLSTTRRYLRALASIESASQESEEENKPNEVVGP